MNRRTDSITLNGKPVTLPICAVFEGHGGRIRAWRGVLDLAPAPRAAYEDLREGASRAAPGLARRWGRSIALVTSGGSPRVPCCSTWSSSSSWPGARRRHGGRPRALGGNDLSWFYTFEWPIFAGIAIAAWWHLIHEDPEARAARRQEREGSTRPSGRPNGSGHRAPADRLAVVRDQGGESGWLA